MAKIEDRDWEKLGRALEVRARRDARTLDHENLAFEALRKTLERKPATFEAARALAFKILADEVADAHRRAAVAARGRERLGRGGKLPGGRKRAVRHATLAELRPALLAELGAEFLAAWGRKPADALPGPLAEVAAFPPRDRRSRLVQLLDHALGDVAPWAVHPTPGRQYGARRRGKGRGLPKPAPPRPNAIGRLRARLGRELTYHDLMGIQETPEYQASLAEWNRTSRPGADEYLTDCELAIVSLLVGNWPRGVKLPAKVGDVPHA